ncbi:hypothetical protein CC1G_10833 [Coprinopsis cinerea okayama7|uniref:L-dopachrome isomerase n=1 Tax=Coprinopsis cinerea (strain Okayama-7 / 130 / ATCC MYA-4618 / FGSC 9003) TaxID=240176 RepID=A8NHI5_COPC7|nr:hypothetical protein CC1G_10833 [Coprinopsis cinerea okayama7\|eukprot:XP_001833768.2 hypothetical protein CC1G_10833 [Coprinopsis cinerea okayama7\
MPSLDLTTNVKIEDEKAFALEFSKASEMNMPWSILGKPEKYISVNVKYNPALTFAGSFDPAFLLTIVSLDNIKPDLNEKYSAELFAFFKEKLGVPGDRGYVVFNDPGRAYIGHQGTTFAAIFGK